MRPSSTPTAQPPRGSGIGARWVQDDRAREGEGIGRGAEEELRAATDSSATKGRARHSREKLRDVVSKTVQVCRHGGGAHNPGVVHSAGNETLPLEKL